MWGPTPRAGGGVREETEEEGDEGTPLPSHSAPSTHNALCFTSIFHPVQLTFLSLRPAKHIGRTLLIVSQSLKSGLTTDS